ncbi:MAG TPA: 2TM domain-containing protein [Clostridia bacterium]|nr:2TM domain-containing protein [Clostridia bacterium]
MTDLEEYQKARDRVQEIKGFYAHVAMYVVANLSLTVLNLATLKKNDGVIWFVWPLIGWGVVLGVHAISVFGIGRFLGKGWEERHIGEEMKRQHMPTDD